MTDGHGPDEEPGARPPSRHSIVDIARLAGVSNMTVSRVINDKPGVGDATRQRVLHLIRQHGFLPNTSARALKTGRSKTLGVICLSTNLTGPTAALFGVERSARNAGYATNVVTLNALDEAPLLAAMSDLAQVPVAGVILISPIRTSDSALRATLGSIPVVAIWAPREAGIAVAAMDHVSASYAATEHLLRLGHRTVHHISGPSGWTGTEQRIQGWREALRSAGALEPPIQEGDWSAQSGALAMRRILDGDLAPTAVFAANDQMALGVMSVCHESGMSIPAQISVVGYDDIPDARFYSPALTTVRQDFDLIASRAVDMIVRQILGEPLQSNEPVRLPLVVRSSTSAPPALSCR